MSTPRTIRMIRVRRAAAISVAAVAVVLGPTACDSAVAEDVGGSGYGAGHEHHGTEVVPVANQERDDEDGDARTGRERGDREDRDDRDDQDGNGRGDQGPGEDPPADGAAPADPAPQNAADPEESGEAPEEPGGGAPPRVIAGEEVLSATCDDSDLPPHDGNQIAPACVATDMGEVPAEENGAQLLITEAPERVGVGEDIVLKVSTRNLIRNRFLPAGQGGYYLERSHLEGGLVRGHFHTACRLLKDTSVAPEPVRNVSFVATEDNKGGAEPDVVTVTLPGLPEGGQAQCAAWAGDASHRTPLMQFANQIPAFDAVRFTVE